MHRTVFSSIPGLYPLGASNVLLPIGTTKKMPDIARCSLGGQNSSLLRTTGLERVNRISYHLLGLPEQEFLCWIELGDHS